MGYDGIKCHVWSVRERGLERKIIEGQVGNQDMATDTRHVKDKEGRHRMKT